MSGMEAVPRGRCGFPGFLADWQQRSSGLCSVQPKELWQTWGRPAHFGTLGLSVTRDESGVQRHCAVMGAGKNQIL